MSSHQLPDTAHDQQDHWYFSSDGKDANGNNVGIGGATVTITQSSGTGSIGSVTDNSNGTYTATVTSPTGAGSGVFVATLGGADVKSGGGSQTQSTITYTPSTLHHFAIATISSPQVAGTSFDITITAQDVNNNAVTGFTGTTGLTTTTRITAPTMTSAFVNGVTVENVSVSQAETGKTITASTEPQEFRQVRSPLLHSRKPVDIDSLFLDANTLNMRDAIVFTDDRPILDRLSIKANTIWRKSYHGTYSRFFLDNGAPLFN